MAVQLAAFDLEQTNQAIEIAEQTQVRRRWGALHSTGARDQDLEVVHASEQILGTLQGCDLSAYASERGARPATTACGS